MKRYTFNRRRVVDQEIYVIANSYQEALERARNGFANEASDEQTVSITLRHFPDTKYALGRLK